MRIVKVDLAANILWQDSPEPLARHTHSKIRSQDDNISGVESRFDPRSSLYAKRLPIQKLAPNFARRDPPSINPPTPPQSCESDEMDWTPTQSSFEPVPSHSQYGSQQIPAGPSPFYGHLPAAPQSQAQKLRNPPNKYLTAGDPTRELPIQSNRIPRSLATAQLPVVETATSQQEATASFDLSQPRFFPPEDYHATGLENLFDSSFSLRDEPAEIRLAREMQDRSHARRGSSALASRWKSIAGILFTFLASQLWTSAKTEGQHALKLRLGALGVAGTVAGHALMTITARNAAGWRYSDILLFSTELLLFILLGSVVISDTVMSDTFNYIATMLFGIVITQEIWLLSTPASEGVSSPPPSRQQSAPGTPKAATHYAPESLRRGYDPATLSHSTVKSPPLLGPRPSRSTTKRESFAPSSKLSELSFGDSDDEPTSPAASETTTPSTVLDDGRFPGGRTPVQPVSRTRNGISSFGNFTC